LKFVRSKNLAAAESLEARKDGILAFHRLNVPATLNVTFLSTNNIENVMRNARLVVGRVSRWNDKTDQVARWMGVALLKAQEGFRRVRGHKELWGRWQPRWNVLVPPTCRCTPQWQKWKKPHENDHRHPPPSADRFFCSSAPGPRRPLRYAPRPAGPCAPEQKNRGAPARARPAEEKRLASPHEMAYQRPVSSPCRVLTI